MIENITFEVTSVNPELRCMEVVFRAPGHPDVTVGARMPFEGESISELAASFAPVQYWENRVKQIASVTQGETGAVVFGTPTITPSPNPLESVTPLQFFERFTEAEQLAIVSATMQSAAVKLWYDKLIAATEVRFDDPRLPVGLTALVSAGLLTEERKTQVLTPEYVLTAGTQSI